MFVLKSISSISVSHSNTTPLSTRYEYHALAISCKKLEPMCHTGNIRKPKYGLINSGSSCGSEQKISSGLGWKRLKLAMT